MYGVENPTLWQKIKTIWNYEDPADVRYEKIPIQRNTWLDILKWLAVILMFIDHVGYVFQLDDIFRIIGRASFPIFAFGVALGIANTQNPKKYLLRLWLFALISQIPYMITFDLMQLNILFVLFAGALLCHLGLAYLPLYILAAIFLPVEYGWWGMMLIPTFYYLRKYPFIAATILTAFMHFFIAYFTGWTIEYYAVIGLFLVAFVSKLKPLKEISWLKPKKYFFYWFYIGHLIILFILNQFLIN